MRDRGIALVITLIAIAMFSALGLGVVLTTSAERLTMGNFDDSVHALNAADAALELAVNELGRIEDWNAVLTGVQLSPLIDGLPSGTRTAGATTIDLTTLTNQLTCGRPTACSDAQIGATSAERPWGTNNPRWQPFVYGSLRAFIGAPATARDIYVIVWVGDDAREIDGDPRVDGGAPAGEGRDVLRLRAEAFAAGGSRRAVEADLARLCTDAGGVRVCIPGIHVQSWRVHTRAVP